MDVCGQNSPAAAAAVKEDGRGMDRHGKDSRLVDHIHSRTRQYQKLIVGKTS